MGKLKFGVFLPFYAYQAKEPKEHFIFIRDTVLECERLGFDSVWLDDHLMYNDWPILDSWITLASLTSSTSKIRMGIMVSCNAHRNPALTAKMAATLDVLSGGRLEFGVGAGTQEVEHTAYGFGFHKPTIRIAQLAEALEVTRQLWMQKKANYIGKYYSLKNAICEPKPIQKPYPPITVGGSGELLMQKATAPYADRFDWGILPSIEEYKRKLEVLENQCNVIGRDFAEIEKSCWPGGQVIIARNQKELGEKISERKSSDMSLEDFQKTVLAGTPDDCIEQLQIYVDLGVTYFMLFFTDLQRLDELKVFAEGVINKMC